MRRSSSKRKDKENGDSGSTQDVVAAIHATSESSVAEAVHATSESSVAAAASAASGAVAAAAAAAAEEEQLRTAVGAAVAAGRPRPLLKRAGSAEGTGGGAGHHQHHPHQQGRAYAPESVRVRGSMALINVGSQFRSLGLSLSTSRLNSLGITAN